MCDVARDVYSRGQYKRFTQSNLLQWLPHFTCDWCGNAPHRIYSYVWYGDSQPTPTTVDMLPALKDGDSGEQFPVPDS